MLIEVTAEDIASGKPCNYASCPVALALSRQYNHQCYVGCGYIYYTYRNTEIPPLVKAKIVEYDNTGKMEPFTFEMPDEPRPTATEGT